MLAALLWRVPRLRWSSLFALSICAGLMAVPAGPATTVLWSPYQKLTVTPQRRDGEIVSYEIETNGSWYQHIIDLSPSFVTHHLEFFRATPAQWNAYNLPYRFYPHPASVLVLGAGTGNDVAAAYATVRVAWSRSKSIR
jgi:hypothetical protein